MIAYLILVHRFPEQFKRMFKAIHHPLNHYLIHVDKKSGPAMAADIAAFLVAYPNAAMLDAQNTRWGGYSLVDAEIRGMAQLLKMGADWTHFINLSGQDFPLASQEEIMDFLHRNPGREYIRVLDQKAVRPDTMHRVDHIALERLGRIFRTGISRKFLKGVTPYIGTQWMIVSRVFCEFVCHSPEADRYKKFYRGSFIADEGFFQTIMMNAAPHGEIVPNDLRMIDWVPDGDIKLRPRTFEFDDAAKLLASDDLFARKFDMNEHPRILDILEAHITASAKPPQRPSPELEAIAA
jgi:hypothetical protein